MSVCVYDNPNTYCRECWQNGKLLVSYSHLLYHDGKWQIPARYFFFGANIGGWKAGQLVGDKAAMEPAAK